MFPEWNIDQIRKEAIDNPNLYWLEPRTSFSVKNEVDVQFDFPINAMAFLYQCYDSIRKAPISNKGINKKSFTFYLNNLKSQYGLWSIERIVGLKAGKPMAADGFTNVTLKVYKGHNQTLHELSLDDIPFLNPYDWISLFNIVAKIVVKHEPIF